MSRTRPPYAPEFRRQMVELVRAGRTPEELGREFEATSQTIHNWVKQADRDEGLRSDGLTSAEREEVRRLRREVKQLKIEREILNKPQPGSRGRPTRCHRGIRVREHASGHVSGADDGRTERGPTNNCSSEYGRSMPSRMRHTVCPGSMPSSRTTESGWAVIASHG